MAMTNVQVLPIPVYLGNVHVARAQCALKQHRMPVNQDLVGVASNQNARKDWLASQEFASMVHNFFL